MSNTECRACDIESGQQLILARLGHDLHVTRVERLVGLIWVEGFDPDDLVGYVPCRWVSVLLDESEACQLRLQPA